MQISITKFKYIILSIFIIPILVSCNNIKNNVNSDIDTYSILYSKKFINYAMKFDLFENIDTTKVTYLNFQIVKTINENNGIGRFYLNTKEYSGAYIYYISNNDDLLYNNKNLKTTAYLIGIYKTNYRTYPVYYSASYGYNNGPQNFINIITNVQNRCK